MQIGVRLRGKNYTWENAFALAQDPTRPWHLTPDMLELLRIDYSDPDREPGVESFTPTRIMNCHRQSVLMEEVDYYTDAEKSWPLVRGHMVHALMEGARYPGALNYTREKRMRYSIPTKYGPQLFTAKPDLLVVLRVDSETTPPIAHFKVVDYKSKNGIKHELTAVTYENSLQVNMYGYIASQNPAIHSERGKYLGQLSDILGLPGDTEFVVDELEIVYVDMARVRTFSSAGWRTDTGKRLNRSQPYEYETLNLEPIRLWSPEKVGRFIARRIEERIDAKTHVPACEYADTEKDYLCNYCPVSNLCHARLPTNPVSAPASALHAEPAPANAPAGQPPKRTRKK
jgi:hypothetical protein